MLHSTKLATTTPLEYGKWKKCNILTPLPKTDLNILKMMIPPLVSWLGFMAYQPLQVI